MSKLTGLTTVKSVKEFWPDVVNYVPSDASIDTVVGNYIKRAEILINRYAGTWNESADGFATDINMAANLVVQRLVLREAHPASSAEPAGVRSESVRGVSYSASSTTLRTLFGIEVMSILDGLRDSSSVALVDTTVVFEEPALVLNGTGGHVKIFDGRIDDDLDPMPSEEAGIDETHYISKRQL